MLQKMGVCHLVVALVIIFLVHVPAIMKVHHFNYQPFAHDPICPKDTVTFAVQ